MSVQTDESRAKYVGNNSIVAPYPVPFVFLEASDLRVVVTDAGVDTLLILNTDYNVAGAGGPNGGSITTLAPIADTKTVTIYREVTATQLTVYDENADFPAKSHERALDKLTMLVQQLGRSIGRAFRLRESDGDASEVAQVKNSVFGLDASGVPVFRTPEQAASWLNLAQQYFDRPMKTFADAGERALAVPEFTGQLGTQRDEGRIYIATGAAAGNWTLVAYLVDESVTTSKLAATLDFSGKALTWALNQIPNSALAAIAWSKLTGVPAANGGDIGGTYPGIALPSGGVVQMVTAAYSSILQISGGTAANIIPYDQTPPLITEGVQLISLSITPKFAGSKIRVRVQVPFERNNTHPVVVFSLFRGTALVGALALENPDSGYPQVMAVEWIDSPGVTTATTYLIRIGPSNNSATLNINSTNSGLAMFNGVSVLMTAQEIKP